MDRPASQLTAALDWLAGHENELIEDLKDWLRIPSISTRAEFATAVANAAQWTADHLRASGLEVRICPTGAVPTDAPVSGAELPAGPPPHPVVLAHAPGDPDYRGPHILFYGHYDVQPPDPEEEWESPPFEPVIRPAESSDPGVPADRIVARGASDDKGQVMMFLAALRAWHSATGKPAGGARVTVLIEGEEESGSVNLRPFLEDRRSELADCDVVVVSDTHQLSRTRPGITYGVRGLLYTEVTLRGPSTDLHSGLWGGKVPNPLNELCRILGDLWEDRRRVAIPGFYEDVRDPTPEERAAWAELGPEAGGSLASIGLPPEADVGEEGWTAIEREWARPTAEIHGIVGGYTQPGAKTVIPARATAKVSFRLVADQDPDRIARSFFDWLESRRPPGCKWEMKIHSACAGATVSTNSPELQAAARAIEAATGVPPALIKSGGTIPVAGWIKELLGIETIFMGFGLDDDRLHAPNEKFELPCFRAGARSHACLIAELLRMQKD